MEVLGPVVAAVVGIGALGIVDKKITERLVKWFTFLKGDLISLASLLVGWALAFLFPNIDVTAAINTAVGSPMAELPNWALRLAAGFFIAVAAGAFADHEEAKTGAVVVPGEGQVTAARRYDEGFNPDDPTFGTHKDV